MTELALGVDVASSSWGANGSAVVEFNRTTLTVSAVLPGAIRWPETALTPAALADAIDEHVRGRGVGAVALDGPQGWRDPSTPLGTPGVGRRCEYACRAQGKTGVYPQTFPGTQRPWIEFAIAVFAELLQKPNVALAELPAATKPNGGYLLLECFPTSTWRTSGLTPLPGKGRRPSLVPFVSSLSAAFQLPQFSTSSHDDLQAVVAALPAMAALGGPASQVLHGIPSSKLVGPGGSERRIEGIIWDAKPLKIASTTVVSRESRRSTAREATQTVCVTQGVLDEVNRTHAPGSMMIAVRGMPAGTKTAPVTLSLVVDGVEYRLVVGDSHGAWRSHQTSATLETFDELFAKLADRPDERIPPSEVRILGP